MEKIIIMSVKIEKCQSLNNDDLIKLKLTEINTKIN